MKKTFLLSLKFCFLPTKSLLVIAFVVDETFTHFKFSGHAAIPICSASDKILRFSWVVNHHCHVHSFPAAVCQRLTERVRENDMTQSANALLHTTVNNNISPLYT
jgi:hypothetical protein